MTPPPREVKLDLPEEPDGRTPAHGLVGADYVKRKLEEAHQKGREQARVQGLVGGAGVIVVAVGLTFAVFFKLEARSAEMDEAVLAKADAGSDKKLAPIVTDIALIKADLANVKDDVADIKAKQDADAASAKARDEEILRLLRKKDR